MVHSNKHILYRTLICFIILGNWLPAVQLTSLFKSDLPATIYTNETIQQEIDGDLTHFADLHPDLLYYYIGILNDMAQYEAGITGIFISKRMNGTISYYQTKRKFWAQIVLSTCYQEIQEFPVHQLVQKHFNRLIVNVNEDTDNLIPVFPLDTNRLNYTAVKYYSGDMSRLYDANIDYAGERKQLEEIRKTTLLADLARKNPEQQIQPIDLDQALTSWYLFKHHKDHLLLFKEIALFYYLRYNQLDSPNMSVQIGYLVNPIKQPVSTMNDRDEYPLFIPRKVPQFLLGIRNLFFVHIYTGKYSYIATEFSIMRNLKRGVVDYNGPHFQGLDYPGTSLERPVTLLSKTTFLLNITTPLFQSYRNKFLIEGGCLLGLDYAVYNLNSKHRKYYFVPGAGVSTLSEKEVDKRKLWKGLYYFNINLIYYPLNGLGVAYRYHRDFSTLMLSYRF